MSGVSDKDEVLGFKLRDELRIPEGVGAEVEDCDIGFGVVGLEPRNDGGLVTEGGEGFPETFGPDEIVFEDEDTHGFIVLG